jgi:pimeloyl-ACP methyl ester carboxylesterase
MADVHVTAWDSTGGTGETVLLVHGSTTWGCDPVLGFGAQRPLAGSFRLLVMDRRGYGASPDIERSDYAADAADITSLLGEVGCAHLVGHSYGTAGVMLAAAGCPEAVRSLTLIGPGNYRVAADDPAVAAALRANRETHARLPQDLPAEVYLRAATESVGWPALEPTPGRLRAAASALRELPCWEADIPVGPLRAAPFPKLVIDGTWESAPPLYRRRGGEPLMACARVTAERIGARLLRVPGASHYPHVERPDVVNDALREVFSMAA